MKYVLIVMILSNYGNFEILQVPAITDNCSGEIAVIESLNKAQASQGKKYISWCEIHYTEKKTQ